MRETVKKWKGGKLRYYYEKRLWARSKCVRINGENCENMYGKYSIKDEIYYSYLKQVFPNSVIYWKSLINY